MFVSPHMFSTMYNQIVLTPLYLSPPLDNKHNQDQDNQDDQDDKDDQDDQIYQIYQIFKIYQK